MKRIPLLLIYSATVTMVALAWSSLAFCGEIHDAAKSGDLEKVKALRKGNPNLVFSKDTIGRTPLHWAAKAGHNKDMVELLLVNKAEINAKRKDGCTPLQWAALQSQKDVAELLRRHGGGTNKLLESKQCCLTGCREGVRFRLVTQGGARSSLALSYHHSAAAGAPEAGGS